METRAGLGRVAVVDRGESARRVLRAIRELARAGQAASAVAVFDPADRNARYAREADESVERSGSLEEALRAARADSAWLGPASAQERLAFGEACAAAGVQQVGPPLAVLRRLAAPDALERLALELGVPFARPDVAPDPSAHAVEVVVARDLRGTIRALGVGDASVRRGDQALLVESPSPALTTAGDALARELAIRACSTVGWLGVCAVRLLVDPSTRRWSLAGLDPFAWSAPAVEALAGIDLFREALVLARGASFDEVATDVRGHAFAARLESEDPAAVEPSVPGRVEILRLPSAFGVRADAAVTEGDDAPAGAGGVLATVVARAETRSEALARLEQALSDADVLLRGSASSKAWLLGLLGRREIHAGETGVGWVAALAAHGDRLVEHQPEVALLAAAIEGYEAQLDVERARFIAEARRGRPRVGPSSGRTLELRHGGKRHRLEVQQIGPMTYRLAAGAGHAVEVRVERPGRLERRLWWNGRRARVLSVADGLRLLIEVDGVGHTVLRDPGGIVSSPIPAVVVAIPVEVGQEVAAGDPVARIESMKVEVEVKAPFAGVVREVLAAVNGQVDAGGPLIRMRVAEAGGAQEPEPLPLAHAAAPEPEDPGERYAAALERLRRLILGFDVPEREARRLATSWRELSGSVPRSAEIVRGEDSVLRAFADLQWLFGRTGTREGARARPPLEELWRYLHEPEKRGEGLAPSFVAALRRALSWYGVALEAPGRDLEVALLRMQKGRQRADEELGPILAILEQRLAAGGAPPGFSAPDAREMLERLTDVGQERFPALADLAREVRYRRFDQPALEAARVAAYEQAESDLARLTSTAGEEREALIERLVAIPHPISTLLLSRAASQPASVRPLLVETLLRRYYRVRPLEPARSLDVGGTPCAWAEYRREGELFRVAAAFAPAADAGRAATALAEIAAEVPAGRELVEELYLWHDGPPVDVKASSERLRAVLAAAAFPRPVRRVSVVVAMPGRGLGRAASQQHFVFRGGPEAWTEDDRFRGVHYMLFERMHLARLAKFDLERLPSAEDVYLYRAVARTNPKDERLFAMAEVRDLAPVRDPRGEVVQLPALERMLHEAIAGMRVFQARRAPHQRLEWNRVLLSVTPPWTLSDDELRGVLERLTPAARGLGLEMLLIDARVPDAAAGTREKLLRIVQAGDVLSLRWDEPTYRPLEPMAEYQQKVVQLRRRGLTHPFEIVRMLASPSPAPGLPPGDFVEHDLDPTGARLVPVERPPGNNTANIVAGVVRNRTARYPEGMRRVILLGDPGREMGSVAEPECRRILAAIDLAEELSAPLEWFEVCAGAKISMTTGTENMDWVSHVLRRIIDFTQRGGEINVVVVGITVGAQPYWNAEATMLMHTRGILVMAPGSSMVLTGKQALEYSGSVSAEDNEGIGGYDRIMGPNGQAQYRAGSVAEACAILLRHYDHCYVAPGEQFPRRADTADPRTRDVRGSPHGPVGGAGFDTIGEVFSREKNPDRKKPFEIRRVMAAAIDGDHPPLERWRDLRGGDTAVVWDAHLGGWPVCLVGIQSRPLPRLEFVPADGPEFWSAGTLFPQSSKKIARAVNSASGNRPLVVLANLSGFDGSPESMRRLQLEYGAEIGRAVVNFRGPIVFCVVSRYHGGAFVVFAKTLNGNLEAAAVEGARASVIGGAPAAAVVFAREVESRTRKDPRVIEAEKAAAAGGGPARSRLADVIAAVRSEKLGEVGEEFDRIHSVERALEVGSLDRIIAPEQLRPYLIDAVERGMERCRAR